MNRGEVRWYRFASPDKRRQVLILTRDSATGVLNTVTVAPITRTVRDIPTEVLLTSEDGMPQACAANFDNLQTVPQSNIKNRITVISAGKRCGQPQRLWHLHWK